MDDINLVVSSKSIEENCQLLQKLAEDLLIEQSQNCMQFNMKKTKLIYFNYHPKCWKEAVNIILKKSNRKATILKSYKVVLLLNCLRKVAEKIIAARLSQTAETSDLLNID